jgi:hypothetical protein
MWVMGGRTRGRIMVRLRLSMQPLIKFELRSLVDAHPAELLLGDTGEKLFALIPAQNEVQVIDTASGKTVGKWPVSSKSPGDAASRNQAIGRREQ